MDYTILIYFAQEVIQCRKQDGPFNINRFSRNTFGFTFGISDGLIEIMREVSSLHTRFNASSTSTPAIISESVGVWQSLDRWQPRYAPPSNSDEYRYIYQSYNSALFIWLYLVVHPDDVLDDKVQTIAQTGLEEIEAVTTAELLPLLQIPLFMYGLVCLQEEAKDRILGEFDRIQGSGRSVELDVYKTVVQRCWSIRDRGTRRSWDWS